MRQYPYPSRGIAVTFSSDGLITSLSAGAEWVTGYSAQDLTGRTITHILADHSVFEVPQMMKSAREWGGWDGEISLRNRSGEVLEARGSIAPLAGKGNECMGYLLVSDLNLSATIGAGADGILHETGAKLRMLAHELNNPLAVIMGFTQLILLNPNCSSDVRADLEKVHSELKRLVHVVEQLHTYAMGLQENQQIETRSGANVTSLASTA
jgi:PAS domain S-box-containing protein